MNNNKSIANAETNESKQYVCCSCKKSQSIEEFNIKKNNKINTTCNICIGYQYKHQNKIPIKRNDYYNKLNDEQKLYIKDFMIKYNASI